MSWKKVLQYINPTDLITFAYILITGIFILIFGFKIENFMNHLFIRIVIVIGISIILVLDTLYTKKWIHVIHIFYPLALFCFFYTETDVLNNVFFQNLDKMVANIEVTIFQCHPSVWFARNFPWRWFSEIMNIAYFSFYVLILVLIVRVYRKSKQNIQYTMFILCFAFYVYYLLFIIFPVSGPQYYLFSPDNQVRDGYFFSYIMNYIHVFGERPTAAFPSSHVGIMVLLIYLSAKFDRKILVWYISFGILLMFSTVYIKAHYLIDVVAGLLSVPTMYWLGKQLYEFITHGLSQELKIIALCEQCKDLAVENIRKVFKKKQ